MPDFLHPDTPLAQRMRPKTLNQVIGQRHLIGTGQPLTEFIERGHLPSLIFHGEAGIGKTTLAQILADAVDRPFHAISAISSGVKELRDIMRPAGDLNFGKPVVFVDEIHRFNKAQQDALLGAVETGDITLIGATTENPSFSVNNALLSRCQVYRLKPLNDDEIIAVLKRAINQDEFLKNLSVTLKETDAITRLAHGDARKALNLLELAINVQDAKANSYVIDDESVTAAAQVSLTRYDKDGDQHYDIISAMIKSVRGSDPDAALYWMARMLVAGEDPAFIARRLVILASEDIGNANPNALLLADAALRSVQSIGMPEARIILGQVVVYLATSAKSNSTYAAINAAMVVAKESQATVPLHLRNGVTELMKSQGYGEGYIYPHDYPNHYKPQQYMPEELAQMKFYEPADNKREQQTARFMDWLEQAASDESS